MKYFIDLQLSKKALKANNMYKSLGFWRFSSVFACIKF